jgi:hypothetical protein
MPRSRTNLGCVIIGCMTSLTAGCLSGGYEEDFQARLQEYKRAAAGEPPAAAAEEPKAKPAAPPAEPE